MIWEHGLLLLLMMILHGKKGMKKGTGVLRVRNEGIVHLGVPMLLIVFDNMSATQTTLWLSS